jgi:hypothetical protein
MSHTFKDITTRDHTRKLCEILETRRRLQAKRERDTITKRLPPGHIYFRGRVVEYITF